MRDASLAWAALGGGIVVYEGCARDGELLSEAVDDWLVSHPVLTRVCVVGVALHLMNVFDKMGMTGVDPIARFAQSAHKIVYHGNRRTE